MRNGAHLVCYADRLAGDLPGLARLLDGPLAAFVGVHVLPFYVPFDGVDAGFDPTDHTSVDPRLGTWDDLAAIAAARDVTADVIVNHVSSRAAAYEDWLRRGRDSDAAGMFLTYARVFPDGATEADLCHVYRPRPGLPFTPTVLADGTRHLVWTTFDATQIDLDVAHPATRRYLDGILDRLAAAGVTVVRLDAVGYAVKTPGTDCFLTDETLAFVDDLRARCHDRGLEVLVELHGNWHLQQRVAAHTDWVYDFALPPLVLHALWRGRVDALAEWLACRPTNAITVLDTHDGIGLVDVAADGERPGLLPVDEVAELAETIHERTGGVSRTATRVVPWSTVPYQVNSTYFDACGRDEDAYLAARALQLFVPGVPQVYYGGLLAAENDRGLLARTGVGRDVNRHHYTPEEVAAALDRPLVQELLRLVELRGTHPAFEGAATVTSTDRTVTIRWEHAADHATVTFDAAGHADVSWSGADLTSRPTSP